MKFDVENEGDEGGASIPTTQPSHVAALQRSLPSRFWSPLVLSYATVGRSELKRSGDAD
jgi:hypothetical protein